jgi:hypothetical protein
MINHYFFVRLNNSSAHSPAALTLVFQLLDQLSWTRFVGYYSDSSSFDF